MGWQYFNRETRAQRWSPVLNCNTSVTPMALTSVVPTVAQRKANFPAQPKLSTDITRKAPFTPWLRADGVQGVATGATDED